MVILRSYLRWRWLHVCLAWWSFWTLLALRFARPRPKRSWSTSVWWWSKADAWNARRSRIVDLLTHPTNRHNRRVVASLRRGGDL